MQRINTTTRAPETLTEIKAALGKDPTRFAHAMAKPIVVERLLREKFDNDDTLHAPQRREIELVRVALTNAAAAFRSSAGGEVNGLVEKLLALLKRDYSNSVIEITWQLNVNPTTRMFLRSTLIQGLFSR